MKCNNCGANIPKYKLNCLECGTITARTREDLQRTDPAVTKGIAWAVITMGLLGMVFVISNSWTDWHSGLDYVGPFALIIVGTAFLLLSNK